MEKRVVVYRGVSYTRYPNRNYYSPSGTVLAAGGTSLHRQLWLDAGGSIPDGWHIHHVDGDLDHNDLDNFACVSPVEHLRTHRQRDGGVGQRAGLAAWRATDAGRAVLRENARKMQARSPVRRTACRYCGQAVETRQARKAFCSPACEVAGRGTLEPCMVCGTSFWRKHYPGAGRTCSYRCGWALRRSRSGL